MIGESLMTINSLASSPIYSTIIERSNSVEGDPLKQSVLNKQVIEAYHAWNMFQASDLFFEGADPNVAIPLTEEMLLQVDLMEHPDSYIEKFFEGRFYLDIEALVQNYPRFEELINEIRDLKGQGRHVPSKLVQECVLIGVQDDLQVMLGNQITPLHWAILNDDLHMLKNLLLLGADISVCQNTSVLERLQLSQGLYWSDDIKLRQALIDHGFPFELLIPDGMTLKELILKIGNEWGELKVMKFVAHNTPNFKEIIHEQDEHGKSLYNQICKKNGSYSCIAKFLSKVGGEGENSISDFERRVSATLHLQEKGDFSRYWASSAQRI